tara:strand:+ start:66 stop:533 length:468 start_codon:yes stop_codon:yes gene_type:complete
MIKIIAILSIFFLFLNCGFKPIYKLSESNVSSGNYSVQITNQVSREIIEEINNNVFSGTDQEYMVKLDISEDLTPLIINTNGTIAKYRIEIGLNYELVEIASDKIISSGATRGYAQYDVVASEISNEDTKKSMTKIATKNALQLMSSRIQSIISK